MRKTFSIALAGLLGILAIGCDSKPTDQASNSVGKDLKSVSTEGKDSKNTPGESGANKPDASASNEPAKTQEPAMDLGKLPASLKNDAYDYYGLGRTDPIKMTVSRQGSKQDASQSVSLTKVESDYAEFTIHSDGALSELGEVKVRLDKSGIKVISVNGNDANPDTFELPNDLKPGKSWPFTLPGTDPKVSGTNKVVGTQSVKTAVGTYKDALLVVTNATGTQGGQKIQLTSKQWLVKGRGQVKAEITNVSGKTTTKVTMEESK